MKHYQEAAQAVQSKISISPKVGLILGSGLGDLADDLEHVIKIQYNDIPHFPVSTVAGHAGQFVIGTLEGKDVIAMQGRFHYYEGYSLEQVTLPVRVMQQLGVETVIITNAAGGVNTSFTPGDLMLITDHLNLTGSNPLIGKNDDTLGPRFPDMSSAYTPKLQQIVKLVAEQHQLELKQGVYAGLTGPTYETPAEIRMLRILGADAVGMSTVPEVIVAAHAKMQVIGISCITNMAAGILDQPLHHEEVMETAAIAKERFKRLIKETLRKI